MRTQKTSRDQTFRIDQDAKIEKQDDKEEKKDAVVFTGHKIHHVYDQYEDTSDSDDDWADY